MSQFDFAYYQRFYLDPETSVSTLPEVEIRAAAVYYTARSFDIPMRHVIDVGGGIAFWASALKRLDANIHYTLLEHSEEAIRIAKRDREDDIDIILREDISAWDGDGKTYDFALCADVAQYISDEDVSRAIAHIAELTRYALFFETFTAEDVENCRIDERSDGGRARPVSFYIDELRRHGFLHLGACFFLREEAAPIVPWELDRGQV